MKKALLLLMILTSCESQHDKDSITFVPFSSSVIHLIVDGIPLDSLTINSFAWTVIPASTSESNSLLVTRTGDYYLNLEIDRPVKAFLNVGENQHNIFVTPHDTTHIRMDFTSDQPEFYFYGKTRIFNDYYHKKEKALGYSDVRYPLIQFLTSTTSYKSLKLSTDSIINHELLFLESYDAPEKLPEWFVDYERSEINYAGAGYKIQMPRVNAMLKYFEDSLPEDYYDFVGDIQVNDAKAMLSSQYFFFLDAWFSKNLPVEELDSLSGFARINRIQSHRLRESKLQLSEGVRDLYHKYSLSSLIPYFSNSVMIDSVAKEFEVADYQELLALAGTRSGSEMKMLNLNKGDTIPDFVLVDGLDSLVSIRTYQDKILYVNFWATWCGPCIKNIPKLNAMISSYGEHSSFQFLNICIDSEREKWLASVERYNVQGVNLFAEGNWNSKLKAYFNISGIPHYVILNKGNTLHENGAEKAPQVREALEALLH